MEVRCQHKTGSKFLINANFLCNNDPVTTTLLWNTIRGYTLHYLSEDGIWSKVTVREQRRQYLHLLSYVFFQCWFIQMHITIIMIKEWPHKWHHKCWLVRWTPKFVHLQQWKHSPFDKASKTHMRIIIIQAVLLRYCTFFMKSHSDGKRRQN